MLNQQIDKQKLIKNLLAVAPKHCDNCGHKYSEKSFDVVKSSLAGTVLHLKCDNCGNSYMLNVLAPNSNGMIGAQRTPINVDLTSQSEIIKFAGSTSVSKDEALDVHLLLSPQLTQKQFRKLFSRK